jgi:hypothetical protein
MMPDEQVSLSYAMDELVKVLQEIRAVPIRFRLSTGQWMMYDQYLVYGNSPVYKQRHANAEAMIKLARELLPLAQRARDLRGECKDVLLAQFGKL